MKNLAAITNAIQKHYGLDNLQIDAEAQSGGDMHNSFVLTLAGIKGLNGEPVPHQLFAKYNSGAGVRVLKSEFESLNILHSIYPERYPQAVLYQRFDNDGILLLHFYALTSLTPATAADAGRMLALQHKCSHDNFGWPSDNYIGHTPQLNSWSPGWVTFFREQRLNPMAQRAAHHGLAPSTRNKLERLIQQLDELLSHKVTPSLVHGDLWAGNLATDQRANRALFYDPAPYYGDREIDLAMTELFGRLPDTFYTAYQHEWPLAAGYEHRRPIYNLYHALNHVVLFGPSYVALVESCLRQIDVA